MSKPRSPDGCAAWFVDAQHLNNAYMTSKQQPDPSIKAILISALGQEEFVLYCQEIRPAAPRQDQRPFQEILIRFKQEEEKLLPPGAFFSILEENGLMPTLDRWVTSKLGTWIHSGLSIKPDWLVPCSSINLSAQTIDDSGFPAFVKKHMEVAQAPKHALAFEISWSTIMADATSVHALVTKLKSIGCRIVVAGFDGTGESIAGLRYLKPDCVKISTTLLRNLKLNSAESYTLSLLNSRCRAIGVATIAEQIESEEVLSEVTRIGMDYVQGFGLSHPKPLY